MSSLTVLTIVMVEAVIFVNGLTDAPNAIAGVVSTNVLSYPKAVGLAAICNLLGIAIMSLLNASVASTITSMVDFSSSDSTASLIALLSALIAIVLFSVGTWMFGIPSSESHTLMAALMGAALAINPVGGIKLEPFAKVLWGLGLSLGLGFLVGFVILKLVKPFAKLLGENLLGRGQIAAAAAMAFTNGAQDGQKFIAVFVIAELLTKGIYYSGEVQLSDHLLIVVLCAATTALGTSVGGKRIIETVGTKMVRLDRLQGFCSDIAGAICLFLASLWGLPVSSTHTKTSAVMGTGCAFDPNGVDWSIVGGMVTAWVITFPAAAGMGWLLSKAMLFLFT